jgi:hypothetical protein
LLLHFSLAAWFSQSIQELKSQRSKNGAADTFPQIFALNIPWSAAWLHYSLFSLYLSEIHKV